MRSRIKNVCFLSGTGVRKCVFSSWLVEVFKQLTGQYWGGGVKSDMVSGNLPSSQPHLFWLLLADVEPRSALSGTSCWVLQRGFSSTSPSPCSGERAPMPPGRALDQLPVLPGCFLEEPSSCWFCSEDTTS